MSSASTSSHGGGSSSSSKYPMVEKTFRPRVTEEMEHELRLQGQSRIDTLTADVRMIPIKSKANNVRLFEREEREWYIMKGVTTIQASLTDIMSVLKLETTSKLRDVFRVLFGGVFLDGVVLYTAKDSSARPHESLSINWMALQAAKPHLPARDYVYVRYNDVFEKAAKPQNGSNSNLNDGGGRLLVGASIWESVEVDGCAPLPPSQNVTRLRLRRCGIIVEELNRNDQLQVSLVMSESMVSNGKTIAVSSLTKQWMHKMVSSVARFSDAIVAESLGESILLTKQQFVMDGVCCYICCKSFSLLRRKHHCRVCGDVVCNKCSDMKLLRQEGKMIEVRVCVTCKKGSTHSSQMSSSSMQDTRVSPSFASGYGMSQLGIKSTASTISDDNEFGHSYHNSTGSFHGGRGQTTVREHSLASNENSTTSGSADMILLTAKSNDGSSSRSAVPLSTYESKVSEFSNATALTTPALTIEEQANVKLAITVRENTPFAYALSYSSRQEWPLAPIPVNEAARVAKVRSLQLVDANFQYQEMCEYAAAEMGCQVGAVCFIGEKNGFLLAKVGLENREVPRNLLFEAHTIMSEQPTVVLDAAEDIRFVNNPLVKDNQIRFYAGFPLVTHDGFIVGSLTIADPYARECLTGDKYFFLKKLSDLIIRGIEENTNKMQGPQSFATPSMSTTTARAGMDVSAAQLTMQELLRTAYTTQCQVRMNVESLSK